MRAWPIIYARTRRRAIQLVREASTLHIYVSVVSNCGHERHAVSRSLNRSSELRIMHPPNAAIPGHLTHPEVCVCNGLRGCCAVMAAVYLLHAMTECSRVYAHTCVYIHIRTHSFIIGRSQRRYHHHYRLKKGSTGAFEDNP